MNDTYVPGELEHCVLSVIWRIQPCTAYQVRRAFQTSLTASWRASTGSIYPLLRKLVAKGFVIQAAIPGDRRHGQALKISPAAAQSLKSWLQDSSSWIAEPVADPIRTRSYVLPMLHPGEARHLIARWRAVTEDALREIGERLDEYRAQGNITEQRAHRGTQLQLAARMKWLDELLNERP